MSQLLSPEFPRLLEERERLRLMNSSAGTADHFLFAEAALALVTLERFLRVTVGARGKGKTLRTLLLQATDSKSGFLHIEGKESAVRAVADLRNAVLHGDFESACAGSGCASVEEYLETKFKAEIQLVTAVTDSFLEQFSTVKF